MFRRRVPKQPAPALAARPARPCLYPDCTAPADRLLDPVRLPGVEACELDGEAYDSLTGASLDPADPAEGCISTVVHPSEFPDWVEEFLRRKRLENRDRGGHEGCCQPAMPTSRSREP